jgi:outer membrane autotransporter protein
VTGIYAGSDNPIVNNSGVVSATGTNSFAISGQIGVGIFDTTLNLLAGSQIIGVIDLRGGADNDTANVYSGSVSAHLTFENTENINLFGPGVVVGNTVMTVDPTGESTRGMALAGMNSSIHNVISNRMAHTTPLKPVQVASLELSPGMYFAEHKPVAWAQVFGGKFDRDAEGGALGYDHDHVGINFGYEWDKNQTRVGLMGGFVQTDTETHTSSFESDATNAYVGAYSNYKAHGMSITTSVLAGYGDNDNDRLVVDNLNGYEVAKSDFDSWFISPGVTVATSYALSERLELRPSASANYSIAWLDGYRESGTTNSNLSVDDRQSKALTARLQLATAYQFSPASEVEVRVGMNSRHTDDDDTKVSIAGSSFKFASAGDENVTGSYAGINFRVASSDTLSVVADVEVGGEDDEDYAAGNVSLRYLF